MLIGVYMKRGICLRNHCRTEPPRDPESSGVIATVGGGDRAPTSDDAADRVQASAGAARRRFRGIHGRRAAASLPAESGTVAGGRRLAGSVPPVLVGSSGCSRTPP